MEMKKIFSWKIITLLLFANVILYFLLFEFHIQYFPNGRPATNHFIIEQQFIPKYGPDVNEREFADFVEQYEKKVKDADTYLQNDPKAKAAGLSSFEAFKNARDDNQKQMDYRDLVFFDRNEDLFWELQAMEYTIEESYKYRTASLESNIEGTTGALKKHIEELLRDEKYSFYTSTVLDNFVNVKKNMAIILFISTAILLSPIFLRDKLTALELLQYSSKKGRRIYKTKWLAGLASSVLLTTFLLVVYLTIYAANQTSSHFDLPLYAMNNLYSWYDLTFWQYIILSVLAIFLVSILLGILTMTISTIVSHTIGLIGVQIVTVFVMIAVVTRFLIGEIVSLIHPIWFVPLGYSLFLVGVIVFMLTIRKREMKRDIV
ncbi:hypothetical protein SLL00_13410 [Metabacillus indicus]|uniref:hypothetical protein n=1 Tax=Metabacillus indicus TaxID=246786 RepID=UPI002A0848EA|nr:hypothetical protein [Metabacillus indicus]MDX8290803.1 hypothetical protein [Metabacillus indicus]